MVDNRNSPGRPGYLQSPQPARRESFDQLLQRSQEYRRQKAAEAQRNDTFVGDLGTATATGLMRLPGALAGFGDIVTSPLPGNRLVSKAASAVGEATGFTPGQWADERGARLYSRPTLEAQQNIQQADPQGFGESAAAYFRNPRAIGPLVAESLAPTVAGALLTRGLARPLPNTSAFTRAGIGEGSIAAGMTMDAMPEDVPEGRAAAAALGVGATTGAFGAAGARLARRYGLSDPELIFAGGRPVLAPGQKRLSLLPRVVGGAVSEGVLQELPQGVSETAIQNWAEGVDIYDGIGRAAVESILAGGVMGGVFNVLPQPQEGEAAAPPEQDLIPEEGATGAPKAQTIQDVDEAQLLSAYDTLNRVAKNAPQHRDLSAEALERMERIRAELVRRGKNPAIVNRQLAQTEFDQAYDQLRKAEGAYEELVDADPEKARKNLKKQDALRATMDELSAQYPDIARAPAQAEYNRLVERTEEIAKGLKRAKKKRDGRTAMLLREARDANLRRVRELKDQFELEYTGDDPAGEIPVEAAEAAPEAPAATRRQSPAPETARAEAELEATQEALSDAPEDPPALADLKARWMEGELSDQIFTRSGELAGGQGKARPRRYFERLQGMAPDELMAENEALQDDTRQSALWRSQIMESVLRARQAELDQFEAEQEIRREQPLGGEELGQIFSGMTLSDLDRRRIDDLGSMQELRGQAITDLAAKEGRDRKTIVEWADRFYQKIVRQVAKSRGVANDEAQALVVAAIGERPSVREAQRREAQQEGEAPASRQQTQTSGQAAQLGAAGEAERLQGELVAARETGADPAAIELLEDELAEAEGRAFAEEIGGGSDIEEQQQAGVTELVARGDDGEGGGGSGGIVASASAQQDTNDSVAGDSVGGLFNAFIRSATQPYRDRAKGTAAAVRDAKASGDKAAIADAQREDAVAQAQFEEIDAAAKDLTALIKEGAKEAQLLSDDKQLLQADIREGRRFVSNLTTLGEGLKQRVGKPDHQAAGTFWGVANSAAKPDQANLRLDGPSMSWAEVGTDPRVYQKWMIELGRITEDYGLTSINELVPLIAKGDAKVRGAISRKLVTAVNNTMKEVRDEDGQYVPFETTVSLAEGQLGELEETLAAVEEELARVREPIRDATDAFFRDFGISGAAQSQAFGELTRAERAAARDEAQASNVEEEIEDEAEELNLDATGEARNALDEGRPIDEGEFPGIQPAEEYFAETDETVGYTDEERYSWNLKVGPEGGTTVEEVEDVIAAKFSSAESLRRRVTVVQSWADMDLIAAAMEMPRRVPVDAQGLAYKGRYYLIADNIPKGKEFSVFMHEVGVHGGMETLLGKEKFAQLAGQITKWAEEAQSGKRRLENVLADKAWGRVGAARVALFNSVEFTEELTNSELVAYFVEEAVARGVDPTALQGASPGLAAWWRTLWAAFKSAVRKLGVNVGSVSAQNVVDMAYGGARFALNGAYHGVGEKDRFFRKFRWDNLEHGISAWGHYAAQRRGHADQFRVGGEDMAAVEREMGGDTGTYTQLVDFNATPESTMHWENRVGDQHPRVRAAIYSVAEELLGEPRTGRTMGRIDELFERVQRRENVAEEQVSEWLYNAVMAVDDNASQPAKRKAIENAIAGIGPATAGDLLDILDANDDATVALGNARSALQSINDEMTAGDAYDFIAENAFATPGAGKPTLSRALNRAGVQAVVVSEKGDYFGLNNDQPSDDELADRLQDALTYGEPELVADAIERLSEPRNVISLSDPGILRIGSWRGGNDSDMKFSILAGNRVDQRVVDSMGTTAQYSYNTLRKQIRKLSYMFSFTHDLADRGEQILRGIREWHTAVNRRSVERNELDSEVQRVLDPAQRLKPDRRRALNRELAHYTVTERWPFDPVQEGVIDPPAPDAEPPKVSKALSDRFQKNLTAEEQVIAINMFRMAYRLRKEQSELTAENINRLYAEMLERAESPAERQKLADDRDELVEDVRSRVTSKPAYLPLRRFGKYAVVFKSPEMEEAFSAGDQKRINEMKADSEHYRVSFREDYNAAQRLEAEMREQYGDGGEVELFERADMSARPEFMPASVMEGIKQNLEAFEFTVDGDGNEVRRATVSGLQQALNKLYIETLNEDSARKSELTRIAVAGFEEDMIRSFAAHSASMSANISALKLNRDTQASLQHMAEQARETGLPPGLRDRRNELLNEVMTRQRTAMNPYSSEGVQKVMGATSVWMLLTSPAYYIQNSTQPFVLSMPWMGARHGMGKTFSRMSGMYKTIGRAWIPALTGELSNIDANTVPDPNHREVLRELQNRGLLDIGIAADLGSFKDPSGTVMPLLAGAHQRMVHAMRTVELFNRGTTALTAFELELEKNGGDIGAAKRYAIEAVEQTQGDYSVQNAPSIIERMPLGRVITQFRKFQLIQLSILARAIHGSFYKADPVERGIARRQLLYILGTHGAVGGALGLPFVNLAAPIVGMALGGDDEPNDMELQIRRAIGNKEVADLVLRGLPTAANIDVSARLGMGMATSILPFTDIEFTRDGAAAVIAGLLGPSAALAQQMTDGAGQVMQGSAWLGTAQMVPRGLRDVMRAVAYKTEGVRRRGAYRDVAIDKDDISWFDFFGQGLGWPTQTLTDRYNASGWLFEMRETFAERSAEIKAEYMRGDRAAARKQWRELQQTRREYGLRRQAMSLLTDAVKDQAERERNAVGGVPTRENERAFVESLLE